MNKGLCIAYSKICYWINCNHVFISTFSKQQLLGLYLHFVWVVTPFWHILLLIWLRIEDLFYLKLEAYICSTWPNTSYLSCEKRFPGNIYFMFVRLFYISNDKLFRILQVEKSKKILFVSHRIMKTIIVIISIFSY